jgi:hypothetical protein
MLYNADRALAILEMAGNRRIVLAHTQFSQEFVTHLPYSEESPMFGVCLFFAQIRTAGLHVETGSSDFHARR